MRKLLQFGRKYNENVNLVCPTIDEVKAYLLQHGYSYIPNGDWVFASKPTSDGGTAAIVDIPLKEDASYYRRCLGIAIDSLAFWEGKTLSALVREIVNHDDQCCGECKFCEEDPPDDPTGKGWGICKAPAPQWAGFSKGIPLRPRVVNLVTDGGSRVSSHGITEPCAVFEQKEYTEPAVKVPAPLSTEERILADDLAFCADKNLTPLIRKKK